MESLLMALNTKGRNAPPREGSTKKAKPEGKEAMVVKKATLVVGGREKSGRATRDPGLRQKGPNGRARASPPIIGEGLDLEGHHEMNGQELYQKAERLARNADRNGGPLPVTLLQEAAATGYVPAIYAL